MAVRARPLWNTIFLPINFVLTGWLGAIGAMLFVARWLPGGLSKMPAELIRRLSLAAVAMLVLSALAWSLTGVLGEDSSFRAAWRLYDLFPVWRLSLFGSVLAGAVMFGLVVRHARFLRRPSYSLLVAGVMMAASWIFRWIIFMSVQGVPKYGAGLYIYQMPLGGDGLLGMVGVLGLCIALLASAIFLINRFPGRTMHVASLA
jgi:tetrathionate reductase subunit C